MNEDCKPWYLSKGLLGPLASLLLVLLRSLGFIDVDADQVDRLLYALAEVTGLVVGLIGRARATRRLTFFSGRSCVPPGVPSSAVDVRQQVPAGSR